MTNEKWRELTAKAIKSDGAAFEELYNASKRSVYFICSKMLNSDDDAKDAVQNTYITAYQKLNSLDDGANFLKWINGIAANKCKEFFHGKALDSLDEKLDEGIEFADEEFIPEDYVTDMERRRIIMNIIETELSDVQRQTVILYYYNQLTVSQIADEMSCPENTVKYRLCAAREKIREAVLIYEKEHDDRLHAIMPIPVLTRIFRTEAEQISVPDIPLNLPMAASAPANTILKKAGESKMKNAITGKIIAGVVALGVIGGGIAIAVNSSKDKEPTEAKSPVQVEESSTPTEVTEPIADESTEAPVTETTITTTLPETDAPDITSEAVQETPTDPHDGMGYMVYDLLDSASFVLYYDAEMWVEKDRQGSSRKRILADNDDNRGYQITILGGDWMGYSSDPVYIGGTLESDILYRAEEAATLYDQEMTDLKTEEINGYTVISACSVLTEEYAAVPEYKRYYYIIVDDRKVVTIELLQFEQEFDDVLEEMNNILNDFEIKK